MKSKHLEAAIYAHTNLNVFAAVGAILEGGVLYGGANKAADKILAICRAEQQRQLRLMDKATAALGEIRES